MNKREENNIIKIKAEQDDYYSNDDIYDIKSWGADLSFRELIEMYKDNDLEKPELQRKYVWDRSEASRFIDSILLGLPVPSIFLAKKTDEKMLIIDGYQRIMTVYDYVERGIFSGDGKTFKLTKNEKTNARWRGKNFAELSETEQRRIKTTTIHAIIFPQFQPRNSDSGMYQVFERINTSGRTLLPQEIRNCVYHGNLNKALLELNKLEIWRTLYGLKEADSRMRDMEFILRYFAMRNKDFKTEDLVSISLKKFLNDFMGEQENNSEQRVTLFKNDFTKVIKQISTTLGSTAFHNASSRFPDKLVNKFNPTIFDSISVATAIALDTKVAVPDDLDKRRWDLLRNTEYQDSISIRTTNVDKIKLRISLALKYLYDLNYE